MGKSDLKVYLVLLVAASAAEDVGEDYDYLYSDFFPELSAQPSGLDTTDADSDKMHELRSVNCMAVPKLTTVHDDLGLLFRSTPLPRPPPINPRINTSGADRGLRQTQHASDFDDMESDVMMIPVVNRVRTSTTKRSTLFVIASNRVFDFRWNDLIKKTKKIPQYSATGDR
ncbi:uncharacterized protein LOC100569354 [Acyrthosiphon pisum]|uniref:Uncharacterized protein n=1 Tax=Acyrthosiphon pisum TaxID=7029 RepID=A0A8R2JMX8_ACYPI|nr:uncharacterized protein LOC100569354 [Acyrthosiphon pisum]